MQPPSPATTNSSSSGQSAESPAESDATGSTSSGTCHKDTKKHASEIRLLERLCHNLYTLINNRHWDELKTLPPPPCASPSTSPAALSRQASVGSAATAVDAAAPSPTDTTTTHHHPTSIADLISPRFTAELNNREIASSFPEYIQLQRNVSYWYPQYHITIQEISTELDMRHGWANVLVFATITGYPAGVNRQTVLLFKWVRKDRRWWCAKLIKIRGGARYDDGNHTGVVC